MTSNVVSTQTPQTKNVLKPKASAEEKKPTISKDFETFLRMLTVQMENQDPLNPVDSNDYATQLATFSSVEQQVLTNDLLKSLSTKLTGGGLAGLGGWVGMQVRGAPKAEFKGGAIELNLPQIPETDRRILLVKDDSGQTVARLDINQTRESFSWSGQTANGTKAAPGLYEFKVEGYKDGKLINTKDAESYSTVVEAQYVDGKTQLVLAGGVILPSEQVSALRERQRPTQ